MNIYNLICWGSIAAPFILIFLMIATRAQDAQIKINAREERATIAQHNLKIRQADADRRAQLHQAKIERESNAIVLQDLKIETERLKLAALEKEVNPPAFDVKDYSS